MSHTPGPWHVGPKIDNWTDCSICSWRDGREGSSRVAVANILNVEGIDGADNLDNARLIAAAPELLAICQAIAADARVVRLHTNHQQALAAIIAKATGKAGA